MKRQLALFALSVLILVSLACSQSAPVLPFLAPTATPTATPIPLPPTVIETVPPVGSELPLQSPLTVYFSEKMERASVESALTADFSGGFLFSWLDDATLMLTPKSALPSDGKVTITLAASAKAANGLALLEPLTLSYQTAGALRVAQVLPAPLAADVSPDSVVVVTFNQPIVPLGADAASLPAGITLEPTAAGSGEWLNTSTYVFRAEPALSGGVDYVARVNPQLVSTNGAALDPNSPNISWGFRTSLPRIDNITPAAGVDLALDPEIQITFNQPMERASIEGSFAFSGPQGKVDGKMTWNEKASVLTYKPAARLERDTVYELTIGGQSRALGGALLGSDFSAEYRTVQKFGMWYTSFNSGNTRPRDLGVSVTFTASLADYKADELEKLVTISPAPPYFNFYPESRTVNVYGGFKPGTVYEVTFPASLKDQWGQELGQDYVFSFREPDAQPALQLGFYMPVLFARPENPSVFLQAVNVNRIQISRAVFPLDEFFRFRNNYDYRQSYIPANVESWNESTNLVVNQNDPLEVRFTRKSSLPTGLYHVDVSSDEVKNTFNTAHPLLVSNLNVTLKASATSALVWAVDLRTQAPVSNVPLTVYDQDGVQITTGVTDEYGLWQGDVPYSAEYNHAPTTVVLAQPGDEFFGMAMTTGTRAFLPGILTCAPITAAHARKCISTRTGLSIAPAIPSIIAASSATNTMAATLNRP